VSSSDWHRGGTSATTRSRARRRDRRDGQRARPEGATIETRAVLQAALNGDRTKAEHAATPVSVEELARDAAACVAAGARMIHLHPRDCEGRETLEAGVVDEVVKKVRAACGVPVGTTTSAEIEPRQILADQARVLDTFALSTVGSK
jgi:uncharacterized protein (DUF849 family)